MTNNDELYHYGVPGMKWGQRRAAKKLDKVTKRAKKQEWSNDATEVGKIKTKKVKQMSNDELKKVKKRDELERDYKNLNPNVIKKGLKIAGATVAALGTMAALAKYGKVIVKTGKNAIDQIKTKHSKLMSTKVSKAFWKDMANPKVMSDMDFSNLLK